jgi:hypothetical protein
MVLLRGRAVKDLHVHRHMQITVRPVPGSGLLKWSEIDVSRELKEA